MKISKEVANELLYMWKKPNISKNSRAEFIKELIQELNISQRNFCKEFNIPKSTLTGWLVYNKISEEQYNQIKQEGFSDTKIHNTLKSYQEKGEGILNKIRLDKRNLDNDLDKCIEILLPYLKMDMEITNGTSLKVSRLREILYNLFKKVKV